jgi:hypothetical protein
VPDCARGCEQRLQRLGDGRDPEDAPPCPGLTVKPGEDETAAAIALVRRRLADAASSRPAPAPRDHDRLQCGVGRLGLRPPQAEACAREEARVLPVALDGAPERAEDAAPFLFAICAETEGCSGTCARELDALARIDGRSPDLAALAREVSGACPDLGRAMSDGPPAGARDRALAWTRARLAAFAARACPRVVEADRLSVACGLQRLGVVPVPGACGAPRGCEARRPSSDRAGP